MKTIEKITDFLFTVALLCLAILMLATLLTFMIDFVYLLFRSGSVFNTLHWLNAPL